MPFENYAGDGGLVATGKPGFGVLHTEIKKVEDETTKKGKKARKKGNNSGDQFEQIEKEQRRCRKQGDNTSIESIEKSRQRDRDSLRPHNIDLDDFL